MPKKITIRDVAMKAGVSNSAVSCAYHNPKKLSVETRERILRAAADIGYVSNAAARTMRTNTTGALGLLLPQEIDLALQNPYYTFLMEGIGKACREDGYSLLLVPPFEDDSSVNLIPTAAVDGFIVSGLEKEREEVVEILSKNMPLAVIDPQTELEVSTIEIDDAKALSSLVNTIIECGHRRVGIAAIETKTEPSYQAWHGVMGQRIKKILDAFDKFGKALSVENLTVYETSSTYDGGKEAFTQLYTGNNPPTVIISFSDIIAAGVISAATAAGLKVPTDLSVTGYDGMPQYFSALPLTTVSQPIVEKGYLAGQIVLECIKNKANSSYGVRHEILSAEFIEGETLGLVQ